MRRSSLNPLDVECIPERLEEGVLYICERYGTAVHLCCCGCRGEVVTPLTPADWSIRREGRTVTLRPSIGNWGFPCRSHYLIRRNQVVWAAAMTPLEISRVRRRDQADKENYAAEVNRRKGLAADQGPACPRPSDANGQMLRKLWLAIARWWSASS